MIRGQYCAVLFFCLVGTLAEAGAAQDSASDLFHEGFELLQRNDAKRAIEYFERGLKLEPKNALGHFYLAEALRAGGRLGEAREHYERSLKLDSKSSVAEQARAQLQAATDASPKAQPATPVKAAGFDEQAMHEAIALVDEIADLGPWFSFCRSNDGALSGQCESLHLKIQERHAQCTLPAKCYSECMERCDHIRRLAYGSDTPNKRAKCYMRYEKSDKAFDKVDNFIKEWNLRGLHPNQSEYRQYFEKRGAVPDQAQSLVKYLITQLEAKGAQYEAEILKTDQHEMTSFDDRSGTWCGGSDEFNERVARAKEIRAEIKRVLAGQGNAVVSPSATSSSSQPEGDAAARAKVQDEEKRRRSADNDNGVIRDMSGLDWTQADNGSDIDWRDAWRWCAQKGEGWRLPTTEELRSLVGKPAAFRLTGTWYWNNEPEGRSGAWRVALNSGKRIGAFDNGNAPAAYGSRALCARHS